MTGIALHGLLVLPAASALLAAVVARRTSERFAVGIAAVGSVGTLLWSIWVAVLARGGFAGNSVDVVWVSSMDIHWHLGVDWVSAPLIVMTTLIAACCLVSLLRHPPACGGTVPLAVLLLVIETGVLGSFMALDMVLFFVFFEVALIPMWFVIDSWGDEHDVAGRRRAATRFLLFTVLGSALMLVGFLVVRSVAGTFDIVEIAAGGYASTGAAPIVASVLIGLGLAVKTPLWPVHIWLPDAHSKAPTVGSVLLAAVLLKLGSYGFIRFWMPVTDPSWELLAPVFAALAVVGIVYAALACLAQTDLKRLIAYSSVGHMGFVVLGVATFTVGGVQAAVFASVAHGLITGLLFFVAGAVKERYGTTDLARLTVLYGRVPRLAGVFAFAAMAGLGLPGLAGFWGEMLAIRAAVDQAGVLPGGTYAVLAVIAAFGVVLASAYFLALMRGMLQGSAGHANVEPQPSSEPHPGGGPHLEADPSETLTSRSLRKERSDCLEGPAPQGPPFETLTSLAPQEPLVETTDVRHSEWVVWSPLIALTLVLGVAPGLLISPVGEAAVAFFGRLG